MTIVFGAVAEVWSLDGIGVMVDGQVLACARLEAEPQDAILRINPVTGGMTVLTRGGHLSLPTDLLLGSGVSFVINRYNYIPNIGTGNGGITRVNLTSGTQATISSGGELEEPSDLDRAANGEFLVLQGGELLRVKSDSGAQRVINLRAQPSWPMGNRLPTGIIVIP